MLRAYRFIGPGPPGPISTAAQELSPNSWTRILPLGRREKFRTPRQPEPNGDDASAWPLPGTRRRPGTPRRWRPQ